ncbi:hypothetical protein H2509_18610 [Stappia sp. F7233]|uniref:Uncharacterized protein n=1 Tax=Stappia albiluteola TaxID=2758565 RepID=A0A839AJ20_9HYPH|nr:hypothetical protein [Stappia albiluteola]MBA5779145.1 hypothetical protein [Stappia albiluteola]
MTARILAAPLAAVLLAAAPVQAADNPLDKDRYSLSETGDGFLRLDRQSGRVSLCKKVNDAWRCVPLPDAERALEEEIAALAIENERLTARNRELEAKILAIGRSAEEAMGGLNGKEARPSPDGLSAEDEKQLDRALDFTEKAMRRFFGLMQSLREELEEKPN